MDDRVIVYVDDAAYAQDLLAPLCASPAAANTHWVLIACAPRMTHRISKWVSHSARENWRGKWANKLFAHIVPLLAAPSERITTVLATGPLEALVEQLQQGHATAATVIDARRPKQAHEPMAVEVKKVEPVELAPRAPRGDGSRSSWLPNGGTLGSLLTGMSAFWALGLE